jgi:hypothetical protein
MFIFNLSQKMVNIYRLKYDIEIPKTEENSYPLWNWYVKPHIVNRQKYVLFLERDHYLSVWVRGVNSKNITEVFKDRLEEVLYNAGIPNDKINQLKIQNRESYMSKTSDKVWIGVSNEVVKLSENSLYESQNTTRGLHPLLFYKPNLFLYGGPNYKWPEDEVRKLFGLEPFKR